MPQAPEAWRRPGDPHPASGNDLAFPAVSTADDVKPGVRVMTRTEADGLAVFAAWFRVRKTSITVEVADLLGFMPVRWRPITGACCLRHRTARAWHEISRS